MSKRPPSTPSILGAQGCILKSCLPWDAGTELKLFKYGVECLENINVFESQEWDSLFDDDCYTKVQKHLAKVVSKTLEE